MSSWKGIPQRANSASITGSHPNEEAKRTMMGGVMEVKDEDLPSKDWIGNVVLASFEDFSLWGTIWLHVIVGNWVNWELVVGPNFSMYCSLHKSCLVVGSWCGGHANMNSKFALPPQQKGNPNSFLFRWNWRGSRGKRSF